MPGTDFPTAGNTRSSPVRTPMFPRTSGNASPVSRWKTGAWPRSKRPWPGETAGRRSAEVLEDLSLHILDIAENSIGACAKMVEILLTRDAEKDSLRLEINDDGRGMDGDTL